MERNAIGDVGKQLFLAVRAAIWGRERRLGALKPRLVLRDGHMMPFSQGRVRVGEAAMWRISAWSSDSGALPETDAMYWIFCAGAPSAPNSPLTSTSTKSSSMPRS